MLLPTSPVKGPEKLLLDVYRQLADDDRRSLIAFAEFLLQRATGSTTEERRTDSGVLQQPQLESRPTDESVIAAIKRLSRIYPMVDKASVFHETSDLMSQHVMQGRAAEEVIDDLENLFLARYQSLNDNGGDDVS